MKRKILNKKMNYKYKLFLLLKSMSSKHQQQFNQLSRDLTKCLSKKDKKDNGIYFTPYDIIDLMFANLDVYKENIKTILEPSAGSYEIIDYIDKKFTNISITGIELNKVIYENIKKISSSSSENNIKLLNLDYLEYLTDEKFDLIIGNPPYVVLKKVKIDKKFSKLYDGRPNLFILFIIHSLQKLNENGILAFILPSNFMNCLYYSKLREMIIMNYKIINIIDCSSNNSYLETQQDTIIFIIQKSNEIDTNKFFYLKKNSHIIFNTPENIIKIKDLYENSKTLDEMNFEVKVGNITWNEHKDILTDDNKKTRLIYSSDIKDNKLIIVNYKNDDKKNFIDKKGNNDLLLVVNRGYGKGKYKFNYCLIDIDDNYLIENHLIYIKYKFDISRQELKKLYNKIIKSFMNKKTNDFIMIYFGNNAINTTELQYILPIYEQD